MGDEKLYNDVHNYTKFKLVEMLINRLNDGRTKVDDMNSIEDLADEHGFEFDWTSEATMSKSRSMFRSVAALAEEFASQSEAK